MIAYAPTKTARYNVMRMDSRLKKGIARYAYIEMIEFSIDTKLD